MKPYSSLLIKIQFHISHHHLIIKPTTYQPLAPQLNQMKPYIFLFWHAHLHLLLLLALTFMYFSPNRTTALVLGNQTDNLSLLKFKESIFSDPYSILDSWNSSTHFCNWHGITCNSMHSRVSVLNLSRYQLHGSLSPHVANLSFLKSLDLGGNSFFGNIPQELGRLSQLQQLRLTNNSFTGEIPTNLTNCSNLKALALSGNNLTGKIPLQIGSLQNLQILYMGRNNLSGGLLPLVNLSSLTTLYVPYNNLEGGIPQEICLLKSLQDMVVTVNKLSGTLPSCLYNMSSLTVINVVANRFDGSLPPNMFHTLPNIQHFGVSGNQISGLIPISLANASKLALFDIGRNHFVGQVPSLEKLQDLYWLGLPMNILGDNSTKDLEFLKSLTNCSKLSVLIISYNNFGGSLQNSIGNLSTQLSQLYLGGNQISGKIPLELGNLINLTLLAMENSNFEGMIPATFGKFHKLQLLELSGNKLSGDIPNSIGNLSQLFHLGLGENILEGNIPLSIGNCHNLQMLNLSQNNLSGAIPLEVFNISSLTIGLYLSQNSLSGSLPNEMGQLQNIGQIDVSENRLSGEIPGSIGECRSLEYLYLQGNSFRGIISSSLTSVKGLRQLDLSRNRLSGSIPKGLQNTSFLESFNVSFNMLEGEVPTGGVFKNSSNLGINGNNNLCGGISQLHLPICLVKSMKPAKHHNFRLIAVIASAVSFILILLLVLTIFWMRKRNTKPSFDSLAIHQLDKVSYQNLHNATDAFSSRNLIGSGNFGSVYRGTLESEVGIVAIKVLNLQKKGAHKSFFAECNALKNIRHRNLVKILTCCSSIDYKGQEFKALVYEYMKNGSLESWLHPTTETTDQSKSLNLEKLLNIIDDVASAFHYLHYECERPIIHCDLKPSNVLLDDSMVSHVSDFGLARLLSSVGVSLTQSSTIGIKGTIGYAPPEYGMGFEASIEGDMYSFGILVLEMLTRKRPTDEMFKDGHNLHNYVKRSIPNHLLQIVDSTILPIGLDHDTNHHGNNGIVQLNEEKCLLSLCRIALACSMESPKERMSMIDVIKELNIIKSFSHLTTT